MKPRVNEIEATRDIEANNATRDRIVDAPKTRCRRSSSIPTPSQVCSICASIASAAKASPKSRSQRVCDDRFRALSPDEQEIAMINAGGTRRVMSTGGNRYVTNAGSAFGKPGAVFDPIDKEITPLVDAQRPIIDKSKCATSVRTVAALDSIACPQFFRRAGTCFRKRTARLAGIYRRREYLACGYRYSTIESIGARSHTRRRLTPSHRL